MHCGDFLPSNAPPLTTCLMLLLFTGCWSWYLVLALGATLFGSCTSLISFHIYLLWVGMTTYEWMLQKRLSSMDKASKVRPALDG